MVHEALQGQVLLAHGAGERFLARLDGFLPAFLGKPRLDLRPSARGGDESQPVARRPRLVRLCRHDLHGLAGLEPRVQGDEASVNLRSDGAMPDLRVNGVGEVDGRGARRKDNDLALRREHIHLVAGDLVAQGVEELLRIARLALHLDQSAQPVRLLVRAHAIRIAAGCLRILLVLPVRRDPVLGPLVHVEGADLDLNGLATRTDDRRVQRLVQIELGHRNVVLEAPRNRVPAPVQRTQYPVAVLDGLHQHAHRDQIEDLIKGLPAHDHLLIDRIVTLRSSAHRAFRSRAAQILLDLINDVAQVFLALGRPLGHQAIDLVVDLGIEGFEGEFFELPLHHVHAEAMRQGSVNLQRLLGLLLRGGGGDKTPGTGVVQAVGQLDEENADVAAHGDEHLAQRLRLCGCAVVHLVQLRHAVNEVGDGLAILGCQLLERVVGVLNRIVQQRRDERRNRHSHLGQDRCHRDGMGDVGFTRLSHLAAMMGLSGAIGALNDANVRLRVVRSQGTYERLDLGNRGTSAGTKPHEAGSYPGTSRR